MRITISQLTFLLILTGFTLANDGKAQEVLNQSISLQAKNTELQTVLQQLEKAGKVRFVYSPRIIPVNYRVTLNAKAERLSIVLDNLLRPLQVTYEIVGGQIVLKKEASPESSSLSAPDTELAAPGPDALTVKGRVISETGEELPGVSVVLKGTTTGTATDAFGQYSLTVPDENGVLVFSFIGFITEEVAIGNRSTIDVTLQSDIKALAEVVVVGYGTQRRQDVTGAIATISAKDFNPGQVTTPEQLIMGKVAGVQITSNSGAPGSGSTIRIRGGSSLNASNDPLVVIDGVPVDNSTIPGSPNPLSLINPNDIESFNVLKDASATAIYGSRASNGVILVTTKKGRIGDKLKVSFNTLGSISKITKTVDVLSADQFRSLVNEQGTDTQKALLGDANTDWQKAIFRDAYSVDNNLSLSGSYKSLPYRLSLGYLKQSGVLRTSELNRTSASLNLNPSFFKNTLKINVNLKGAMTQSRFGPEGAIGAAVAFDPTQPIYSADSPYGGYYESVDASGLISLATRNPLSMLELKDDRSDVKRSIGNIQFDYKLPFLPALRANLNLGYDVSEAKGTDNQPAYAASVFVQGGSRRQYAQNRTNKLLDFYLNYTKDFTNIGRVDLTGGYSYQRFSINTPTFPTLNEAGDVVTPPNVSTRPENVLLSFFGRLNYTFRERYVLTATVRRDGSSRFGKETRFGTFPALSLAWRINEEAFLKNSALFSELKLRVGYGITGQQDIGVNSYYPYLPRYRYSDQASQYQLGNQFYQTLRPEGYDANIKWEETTTYNAGLDFGILDGRITGSLDYYTKETRDLLAEINIPSGANLSNRIFTNVGNIVNKGVEALVNFNVVDNERVGVSFGVNATYNQNTITNLSKVEDASSVGILTGGIAGGTGNTVQVHTVGYTPYSFYLYKQVYDESGRPLQGVYADLNGDGVISENDLYRSHSPAPKYILGFNSQLRYEKWSLGFVMRANVGNYMYNNVASNNGTRKNIAFTGYLNNMSTSVLATDFTGNDPNYLFSDYYLENASFLRMDNLNLGYNFGAMLRDKINLRVSASIQNVFVLTKYTGLDPETQFNNDNRGGGIDNNFYPRPRIFSLGLTVDFQ
jgi:iron complex outermembrane receptor protein